MHLNAPFPGCLVYHETLILSPAGLRAVCLTGVLHKDVWIDSYNPQRFPIRPGSAHSGHYEGTSSSTVKIPESLLPDAIGIKA